MTLIREIRPEEIPALDDFLMKNAELAATIFLSCVAILAVVAVVLANTWAKK